MRAFALALAFAGAAACSSGDTTTTGSGGSSSSTSSGAAGGGGGADCPTEAEAELPTPKRHTPRWAFEPWISKDISDTDDTRAFVKGFKDRDIPVGAVVLDSPWETNYNTFVPNPTRYHGFDDLVSELHGEDIKLVLWITAFINRSSYDLEPTGDKYPDPEPDYLQALSCNFFVDQGQTYGWWKGTGGSIDFFNPKARAWYHHIVDKVLQQKIDGWKLDFGDSYVKSDPVETAAGKIAHKKYSEAYYHDFLAFGVKQRGPEFLTMTRAYDVSYDFEPRFFAKKEDSPVAWMGDNRRDYIGLTDALDEMFRSAQAGYVVLGSDIGGYLDKDDKDLLGPTIPFDTELFARWTAIGGLSPFMQLHGRANITPWTVPDHVDEIVAIYKYWAKLHHELGPFWYSLTESAYGGGAGVMRPEGDVDGWAGDYRYRLGDAFLVAPILDATGKRDVTLPAAEGWYDFWDPAGAALAGAQKLVGVDATDWQKVPLYVKKGAIVPLSIDDDVTGIGDAASKGKLTLLVYPSSSSSFDLYDSDDAVTKITQATSGTKTTITLARALAPVLVRVRDDLGFVAIDVGGTALTEIATRAEFDTATSGFWRDPASKSVWVHLPVAQKSQVLSLSSAD